MKRFVRTLCLILVLILALGLVLPGTLAEDELLNPLNLPEGEGSLPITPEKTTLSIMCRDSEDPGASFNTHKALIYEPIAEETNIEIKWDVIPNEDYATQSGIRFADIGGLADIICAVGSSDGSHLIKLYEDGVLIDMKPYIDKYAPALKQFLDDNPVVKETVTLPGGQIVAMGGANLSKYSAAQVMIRKDWLDKLGLGIPETPDEFRAAVKMMIENDANGNGEKDEAGIVGEDYSTARQLGMAFGLSLITGGGWDVDENGEVWCQWTSDNYRALLTFLHELYVDGIMDPNFDHTWDEKPKNAKYAANALAVIVRDWTSNIINRMDPNDLLKKEHPEAVWVPIVWKDTGYGLAKPKENSMALWRTYGISANCKDPVTAIRFMEYMYVGAGRVYEIYGLENVSYTVEDGVKVGIFNYRDTLEPGTFLGAGYFTGYSTDDDFMANFSKPYLKADPELMAFAQEQVERAGTGVTEPFQPPIPSVEDGELVNMLRADLNTYRDEMYSKFVRGDIELSDAEWETYVSTMNSIGALEIQRVFSGK